MSETTCPFHDDGHTLNECPSRPIESIKASQHVAHCNRGEHVGHCKYGPNEWCPVFMVVHNPSKNKGTGAFSNARCTVCSVVKTDVKG